MLERKSFHLSFEDNRNRKSVSTVKSGAPYISVIGGTKPNRELANYIVEQALEQGRNVIRLSLDHVESKVPELSKSKSGYSVDGINDLEKEPLRELKKGDVVIVDEANTIDLSMDQIIDSLDLYRYQGCFIIFIISNPIGVKYSEWESEYSDLIGLTFLSDLPKDQSAMIDRSTAKLLRELKDCEFLCACGSSKRVQVIRILNSLGLVKTEPH